MADPVSLWGFGARLNVPVKKKYGKTLIYPDFQIDLTQTDAMIKRQFSDWLEYFRKETGEKPIERRGVRTATDVLKSLGAYRLLKVMDWQKAEEIFENKNLKSYGDQAAWLKAKRSAELAIKQFAKRGFLYDIDGLRSAK